MKAFSLLSLLLLFSFNTNAQCTGCTINITTADALNHIIPAGTNFCISPTGSCTGLITVNGGTLCNEGHIGSSNVWVTGATSDLTNWGTINSSNVLVDNGGFFGNNGNATIDSLLITNHNSYFRNVGILNAIRVAVSDSAEGLNYLNGSLFCDFFGDSMSTFQNWSCMVINYDFYNAYNSYFMNNNAACFNIRRDWYNSSGSLFNNYNGAVIIARDWYNSGSVHGSQTCAFGAGVGISIAGNSFNSGTIGSVATDSLLICDLGHPIGGLDGNTGTIIGYLASCYCSIHCNYPCLPTGITDLSPSNFNPILFPNPANSSISLTFNYPKSEQLKLEITDMLGKKRSSTLYKTSVGENKTSVDVSFLPSGLYVMSIISSSEIKSKQVFSIIR